jgi:hypothetical protein
VPLEPPIPALSTAMTRRAGASASISAGSQLSRFPRKCWNKTSGTLPSPPPVSRYAKSTPLGALISLFGRLE